MGANAMVRHHRSEHGPIGRARRLVPYPRDAAAAVALMLVLVGCAPRQPHEARGVLTDPQLVTLDHGAPYNRFDGGHGSLLLGDGWGLPEESFAAIGGGFGFAWAVGGRSTVTFELPVVAELDLVADCKPLWWKGAPAQRMRVSVAGRSVGEVNLESGWQQVRLPCPEGALAVGRNTVDLEFSRCARPRDTTGEGDARRLCAAFRHLGLVARSETDPREPAQRWDSYATRRQLVLSPGTAASLVLPASSAARLALGRVEDRCPECTLRIVLTRPRAEDRQLWQGRPADAEGLSLEFATSGRGVQRLVVGLEGSRAADGVRQPRVNVRLPEAFLSVRSEAEPDPGARPHVFLYLIDALRADSLGVYGGSPAISPNIDAFAEEAVTYGNAWSASSWTLPSVVSVVTGLYPDHHGVLTADDRLATGEAPTLAALLSRAGYATIGITHSLVTSPKFGLDAGFDRYLFDDRLNSWTLRSQEVRRRLAEWLLHRPRPTAPVFAFVHTVDPHAPYLPVPADMHLAAGVSRLRDRRRYLPVPFMLEGRAADADEVARMRGLYAGEVAFADRQFGRFLDMLRYLDLYDDALVILLSDHGEEFGEHDGFEHGRTLYEELLRVPLIVKYPRSRHAGARVAERVSLVDILPTVLDATAVSEPDLSCDGVPVPLPDAVDASSLGTRRVWAQVRPKPTAHLAAVDLRAVVSERVKCVENLLERDQFGRSAARWQVFDLASDPVERRSLPASSAEAARCRGLLAEWAASISSGRALAEARPEDEETLEKLRQLGYVE